MEDQLLPGTVDVGWSTLAFLWNYFIYVFLVVLLPGFYVTIRSLPNPKRASNMKHGANIVHAMTGCFGLKYETRNLERLDQPGSYVVIANHQSIFDVISLSHVWPTNCVVSAKSSLVWMSGPFALGLWLAGNIFINRANRKTAIGALDDAVQRMKKEKLRVWIFPEGTRNTDGTILPFKKGAFHMAVQAQIPIVPVVISSYNNWLNFNSKSMLPFFGREVIVEVLEPLDTVGKTSDDVNELLQTSYDKMRSCFDRISKEAQQKTNKRCLENYVGGLPGKSFSSQLVESETGTKKIE